MGTGTSALLDMYCPKLSGLHPRAHIRQSTCAHVITITCENDIFVNSSLMALSIHLLNAKFNLKTGYNFFKT